jgi:RNA polymerase sigma-70 factor (ECF subfamily)
MPAEITRLLHELRAGEEAARQKLIDLVYAELHRIASVHIRRERASHTLQPTALVHEAYLKLFGGVEVQFADRIHFYAVVSQIMRRILVDYARARAGRQRGGGLQRVTWQPGLDAGCDRGDGQSPGILDLDFALDALAREKPSLAQVIEMQYFAGMTAEEIAETVDRSVFVVRHEIRLARAWLRRKLSRPDRAGTGGQ